MDNVILKKRLSSFKSEKGSLSKVSDELLIDILSAWENWTGTARGFHTEIGISRSQLGGLMGKAKRLRRDGHLAEDEFKEIKVEDDLVTQSSYLPCSGAEVVWGEGKIIRFNDVNLLVEFLKKAA